MIFVATEIIRYTTPPRMNYLLKCNTRKCLESRSWKRLRDLVLSYIGVAFLPADFTYRRCSLNGLRGARAFSLLLWKENSLIWYMVDTYSVLDSLPSMPSWFLYVTHRCLRINLLFFHPRKRYPLYSMDFYLLKYSVSKAVLTESKKWLFNLR